MSEQDKSKTMPVANAAGRTLTPEALRALEETEQRRIASVAVEQRAREINGRGGAEPVRFGDWEVKGLATDF